MSPYAVVDVHAHVVVGEVEAVVHGHPGLDAPRALDSRRNGPESAAASRQMVNERMPQLAGVDRRLGDMDAAGADVQLLSVSPSHYHYYAEPDLAMTVCRCANQGVAAVVAEEPDRFTGLGLVPLQHPQLCVEALEHALSLGGADRVLLGSDYPFDMGVVDPVERVRAASLADADRDLVLSANANGLGLAPTHSGVPA